MTKKIITQKRLKELLRYDPMTGIFIWLISRKGEQAGYINSIGYTVIGIDSEKYFAHRLAFLYMTGKFPKDQVDHDNHIRHDNRWKNLNSSTNAANHKNMPIQSANTSGITGVGWHKSSGKWRARIIVNYKDVYLGLFINKADAAKARKKADIEYGFHVNHGC